MKKLITITLAITLLFSCSKTPIATSATGGSGTIVFNGVPYTGLITAATKVGNNYTLQFSYYNSPGTITENFNAQITYNPIYKDSTTIFQLNQMISGNQKLYSNNTFSKRTNTMTTVIYEYKKNPNIIQNANGTFTINDSFKCFNFYNGSTIDTTRYTLYINNVTTN